MFMAHSSPILTTIVAGNLAVIVLQCEAGTGCASPSRAIVHLSLLRLQPSYLERLICMMQDLRRQANRSRARATELSAAAQQANEELNTLHTEMTECLQERRRLVAYVSSLLDPRARLRS